MKDKNYRLPEYPCQEDMWDILARETRPILIYGMGNGADKLIERFEKLNIKFADIFASDGFVRGHSFHGIRVKSFSEITSIYSDFVIVLSFASNRLEVLNMLAFIDGKYDMYIPDMPVAGEEYFDREFYNANYGKIETAYRLLKDTHSKNTFASVITYKLTGKMKHLEAVYSDKEELYSLISSRKTVKFAVDAGAYNGDTIREARQYLTMLSSVIAVEADPKNYKKLLKYTESVSGVEIKAINSALWRACRDGEFISSGNRNSSVSSTPSHQFKHERVSLISLDSLSASPDYIKYDVEGAEKEALLGSEATISLHAPVLLVSVYHRSEDVFSILLYLGSRYKGYDFYFRRLRCVPAWELDLIALPKNIEISSSI